MYKSLENKTKSRQFAIIICLLRKILMKLTTNPINAFQPVKRHDSVQHGRSMIEMLGVLAIIAVLYVGGIAGYTKAIEMWKENNQIEQLNELFYNSIDNFDWFERDYFSNPITGYVKGGGMTILAGIDAIPYGMTVKNKILRRIGTYLRTKQTVIFLNLPHALLTVGDNKLPRERLFRLISDLCKQMDFLRIPAPCRLQRSFSFFQSLRNGQYINRLVFFI